MFLHQYLKALLQKLATDSQGSQLIAVVSVTLQQSSVVGNTVNPIDSDQSESIQIFLDHAAGRDGVCVQTAPHQYAVVLINVGSAEEVDEVVARVQTLSGTYLAEEQLMHIQARAHAAYSSDPLGIPSLYDQAIGLLPNQSRTVPKTVIYPRPLKGGKFAEVAYA